MSREIEKAMFVKSAAQLLNETVALLGAAVETGQIKQRQIDWGGMYIHRKLLKNSQRERRLRATR